MTDTLTVSKKVLDYDADGLKEQAEKPMVERKHIVDANGKNRDIRKYHMNADELAELKSQIQIGGFINPLCREGPYKGAVQALIDLGLDKYHSHATVKDKMAEIMKQMKTKGGNAWDKFSNKGQRASATKPKDLDGRILQNYEVLQRLSGAHKYGYKLMQVLSCIDIKFVPVGEDGNTFDGEIAGKKGTYYYRLRTGIADFADVKPFNNYKGKRRG